MQNFHKKEEAKNLTCYAEINVNITIDINRAIATRVELCAVLEIHKCSRFAALAEGINNKKLTHDR